jgi:phosphonate transport system permease protein
VFRALISAAILIPFLWAALGLEISSEQLRSAPADMWDLLKQMFPPDFSPEAIQRALPKIMESLWIAWIGTLIGAFFSFFLAFAAATNVAPSWMTWTVRQILNAIRAVPELLVAMVLIPVTGLGAWTGTLALGIHSIGTLGKLSSEVIEGSDDGPVEAISSSGGTKVQEMRFGIVPQVMPNIVAYWLYRFEINIRASAVLGVIGAGGIGSELVAQLAFRDFARAGTVLFLTVAVVLSVDLLSARIRRRIITGHTEAGPIATFRKMKPWQRPLAIVAALAILALTFFILYQFQQAQVAG